MNAAPYAGEVVVDLAEAERRAGPPTRPPSALMRVTFAPSLAGLSLPERRWLVHGWIPDRAVTMLGGDGGVGKSLVSLQLMASCALGKPWLGLEVPQRRAFGLFCEDHEDEVHLRVAAVARHHGVGFEDLDGMAWTARAGAENILMAFGDRGDGRKTRLWEEMVARVRDFGAQLVIVDTLADVFGGNENYRAQARGFVAMLRGLAEQIDGAVVLTAHPSVAGQASGSGLSGSTAWNNSVRSRLYLTRPTGENADPDARVLKRLKANYAGAGDELRMTWGDGVLIAEQGVGWLDRRARGTEAERIVVDAVARLTAQGVDLSPNPSRTYAPTLIAGLDEAKGFRKGEIERAFRAALDGGRLRVIEDGPPSKRRKRVVTG